MGDEWALGANSREAKGPSFRRQIYFVREPRERAHAGVFQEGHFGDAAKPVSSLMQEDRKTHLKTSTAASFKRTAKFFTRGEKKNHFAGLIAIIQIPKVKS